MSPRLLFPCFSSLHGDVHLENQEMRSPKSISDLVCVCEGGSGVLMSHCLESGWYFYIDEIRRRTETVAQSTS